MLCNAETMDVLVGFLRRDDDPLAHLAASALWALAPAAHARNVGNSMGAIKHLLNLLKRTFAVCARDICSLATHPANLNTCASNRAPHMERLNLSNGISALTILGPVLRPPYERH